MPARAAAADEAMALLPEPQQAQAGPCLWARRRRRRLQQQHPTSPRDEQRTSR
jgi:hypothetical protein